MLKNNVMTAKIYGTFIEALNSFWQFSQHDKMFKHAHVQQCKVWPKWKVYMNEYIYTDTQIDEL